MLDLLFVKVELGEEKLYLRITFEIIGLDLYEMEKIRNITFRSNEYVGLSTEPSSRFAAQMGVKWAWVKLSTLGYPVSQENCLLFLGLPLPEVSTKIMGLWLSENCGC